MIAADLLGVECGGERRIALAAGELHRRERRARLRGERMRGTEDALALGECLRQADAGMRACAMLPARICSVPCSSSTRAT
jgi:hypothetical protein